MQFILLISTAALIALVLTPLAMRAAQRLGAVDRPDGRRINMQPIPRLGGIAVMGAIAGSLVIWLVIAALLGQNPVDTLGLKPGHIGVALSIIGMFFVGAVDDVKQIGALDKLLGQIICAGVAVASGLVIGDIDNPFGKGVLELGIIAYPVTVFYLVAFANVINLIDGIDGLASGISAIASAALLITSLMAGRPVAAMLAAALVGAALGFLRYNFNPARIFLGDSGSLLLGYTLGVISVLGVTRVAGLTTLIVPIVIAGVPILDTFSAIVRRSRSRINIGQADKGHIHHRLLHSGFSQRQTACIMYAWTAALCAGAIAITQVGVLGRVVIFAALLAVSLLIGYKLHLFDPVLRRRFDPETGFSEVVPISEVSPADDLTPQEVESVILGGIEGEGAKSDHVSAKTAKPLSILAVSQHYWPEPFNIADMCEGLVARGHRVTVLTGTPNYPEGDIYEGYEHGAHAEEEHNGVTIRRVPLIPRRRDPIHRVLNYYSFSINASRIARDMESGFDAVIVFQTTPVMMANPALAYGRRHDVPVLLYCIDIWPESLTMGGIHPGSPIYGHYAHVSRSIYEGADKLAVTSPMFSDYFVQQLGMEDRSPVYLPQYAEDIFASVSEKRPEYDSAKINLTFAGNVGVAQSVATLVEAAQLLADDDRFAIHVVGSGSDLEFLKRYADELGARQVLFHGRHPLSEMPSFYNASDAMVATFRNSPILGYTLPRKIQSYMAAGKPILGTVVGEARRVIEEAGCGLCCDAEDPEGLARICREFAAMSPEERAEMGARGRAYYEAHYARERFFETLDEALQDLVRGGRNG